MSQSVKLCEFFDVMLLYKLVSFVLVKVEDLKAQLAESERRRLEVESQLSPDGFYHPHPPYHHHREQQQVTSVKLNTSLFYGIQ